MSEKLNVDTTLALGQGAYYFGTGVWPLLDIDSFQKVTGPKTDLWLVRTVGVLVAVTGAVLIYGASRKRVSAEAKLLAAGNALGLAAIDLYFAISGTISKIYLADAIAELGLFASWAVARPGSRFSGRELFKASARAAAPANASYDI